MELFDLKFSSYKTNETWLTGHPINITLECVNSQNWKFIFLGCHAVSLGEQFWTFQDITVLSLQSQAGQKIHSSWTTWCLRKHYNPFKHSNYSATQFYIPGGLNLQHLHYENLKSQISHPLYEMWDYHSAEESFLDYKTTQSPIRLTVWSCRVSQYWLPWRHAKPPTWTTFLETTNSWNATELFPSTWPTYVVNIILQFITFFCTYSNLPILVS
jgi:hypothetical protein